MQFFVYLENAHHTRILGVKHVNLFQNKASRNLELSWEMMWMQKLSQIYGIYYFCIIVQHHYPIWLPIFSWSKSTKT